MSAKQPVPTQASHITEQTPCIYVTMDEFIPVRELLVEAKALAIRENTMVVFTIPTYGSVFQVTSESDIERMALKYHDYFNREMVIN